MKIKVYFHRALLLIFLICNAQSGHAFEIPVRDGVKAYAAMKSDTWNQSDIDWLQWMVVNTQPGSIAHMEVATDKERLRFIEDFDPDMFGWWSGLLYNRNFIATSRGIASDSSIEYEYEAPLHGVKYFADQIYGDNGPGVREDGSYPIDGYGDRQMTHLAPKWHQTLVSGHTRTGLYGEFLCQDNLIHGLHYAYGQFDDWSNRKFVSYMTERYSAIELQSMGLNPETFHIRPYLRQQRETLTNEGLIEEPILHEYIRFYYMASIASVVDCNEAIKNLPKKLKPQATAFYGNLAGMTRMRSPGIAFSEHVDMVWAEYLKPDQPCFTDEVHAKSSFMYKSMRSAGHFEKPTCSYLNPPETATKILGNAIMAAEASANGSMMLLANHYKKNGGAEGGRYQAHMHHAQFLNRSRHLLIDRDAYADVAIVQSVPALFWRWFSSLEIERPHLKHLSVAARLLEDTHTPYEVLTFGHPDFYDDTDQLERLDRYRMVILPYVDTISDKQVNALEKWVRAGGKLVLWGEVGTRDEELKPRKESAFASLLSDPGRGSLVITNLMGPLMNPNTGLLNDVTEAYMSKSEEAEQILKKAITLPDPIVETNLPSTTWLNVWNHSGGPMLSLHMINYDLSMATDTFEPVENFTLRVRAPKGSDYTNAWYYRTDYLAADRKQLPEPVSVPIKKDGDYLELTIPYLSLYGVLSLTTEDESEARAAASEVRKWYERLKIASRTPMESTADHGTLLANAKSYLDGIQGDIQVDDFAPFVDKGAALASQLRQAVEAITLTYEAERVDAMRATMQAEAIYKFDFGSEAAPSDWRAVTIDTDYSPSQGYGWTEKSELDVVINTDKELTDDLLLYLPFDDLKTTAQNPQTKLVGIEPAQGVVGNGLKLSGPISHLEIDEEKLNPGEGSFTISAWLKTGEVVNTPSQFYLSKGNYTNTDAGWSILEVNGRLAFRINNQGTFLPLLNTRANYLEPDTWYHLVLVIDRNKNQALGYINGSPIKESTRMVRIPSDASFVSSDPLRVGQPFRSSNFNPGSSIDEFGAWNRALTASDVYELYRKGSNQQRIDEEAEQVTPVLDTSELTMHKDYIRSKNPASYMELTTANTFYPVFLPPHNEGHFRVDLPNGAYLVTAIIGDEQAHYNAHRTGITYIDAEGLPAVYGDRLYSGQYQNRVFPVVVKDGSLDLRFWGRNVGPQYQNNCDWMINGLVIEEMEAYISENKAAAKTVKDAWHAKLREWSVVGPFPDKDCVAMSTTFGPEISTSHTDTFETAFGRQRWSPVKTLEGSAPYLSFNSMLEEVDGSGVVFALAKIHSEEAQEVYLMSSISQFGECYWNGERVVEDRLPAGLLANEDKVKVKLQKGENTLVLKSTNHWGDEWSAWAAITNLDGSPLSLSKE